MNRHYPLTLLVCLVLLGATGCEQQSIAEEEQIKTRQTLEATTPSATPSLTPAATSSPTVGPSPTATLAPTSTPTAVPTLTPLPPTATPNPALAGFSLCAQTAGAADGGRFSARVTTITTTVQAAFERITIGLETPGDSAAPHALARCIAAADDIGAPVGPASAYSLQIDLAGWLHDDAFKATTISPTAVLSGTTVIKSVALRADPSAAAGATLAFGLDQPLPYRLTLEPSPLRLVLDVAKAGAIGANNDMLALPAATSAALDTPLFYVQGGDLWKYAGGAASNLTKDTRNGQFGDISALTASVATQKLAFCAVAPGADVGDRAALRTLWITDFAGKAPQALALDTPSCDDPTFAPDGKQIAFTVDETGANPPRLSIWTVTADGSSSQRVTPLGDEWSRYAPQWLDNGRLVYAAQAEDGRSTLFVRSADGAMRDIGAEMQRGSSYVALGRPLAAPGGSVIAVEALRTQGGADMLWVGPDGKLLGVNGKRSPDLAATPTPTPRAGGQVASEPNSYWVRPLAWADDGTLFYLTSACESSVAQSYTLHTLSITSGADRTIAAGATLGGFGEARALGKGLVYVTLEQAAGPRGPLATNPASPSALWFWDVGGNGQRARLAEATSAIGGLAR